MLLGESRILAGEREKHGLFPLLVEQQVCYSTSGVFSYFSYFFLLSWLFAFFSSLFSVLILPWAAETSEIVLLLEEIHHLLEHGRFSFPRFLAEYMIAM